MSFILLSLALLGSANALLDIPTIEIAPGVELPMAGLGTWLYDEATAFEAVTTALNIGYTHIDAANNYGNSAAIGRAITQSNRSRSSFFITTKVNGGLNRSETFRQAGAELNALQLDYVDLLLIHFPASWSGVGSRALRQEQWRAMEALQAAGLTRAIGVSHFCKRHLQDVLDIARIKPAVNQVEYHVGMGSASNLADDDRAFTEANGIVYQSFSPLCGPCCMDEPTTCTYDRELITGDMVTKIGQKYGKSGVQVALRWQVQQGIPVIPKTSNKQHMLDNADIFDFTLSAADMLTLTKSPTPPVCGAGDGTTSGDCPVSSFENKFFSL